MDKDLRFIEYKVLERDKKGTIKEKRVSDRGIVTIKEEEADDLNNLPNGIFYYELEKPKKEIKTKE